MATCISIIDKDNSPLYVKGIPCENDLSYHYIVHTALDVIEEKIAVGSKSGGSGSAGGAGGGHAGGDMRELYLGLLYPTEDYKLFGYVTNTRIKFVIMIDSANTSIRDAELRTMFRKLHNAYMDLVCNPFYVPGEPIHSPAFDKVVSSMLDE